MIVEFFDRENERSPLNGLRIRETAGLIELFDQLQGRAPFFCEFIGENGYTVLVGIDGNGGCVQYSRTDGRPPYLMAVSAAPAQSDGFVEFLIGGTSTPVPSRYYLPSDAVRQIATYFQKTGERSPEFSWEEI
ncbi:Imm1 family immunity protein [Bradyrhizobium oligotrophicum]|uniref:Imm1 family immunity protein n=1 Tax=Bradyrhizobium oligotrophicum TaxID=44255 RepID=UPI003EB7F1C9